MATKRKAGSKTSSTKGSSPKMEALLANDPPIVVSGGGGGFKPSKKGVPAKNNVTVGFNPKGGPGHGNFSAQTNGDAVITSAQITFPGMTGVRPVTISGFELYTIQITFITGPPVSRGATVSRKGKTSGKRAAARKSK
jgi:hypothetical protein